MKGLLIKDFKLLKGQKNFFMTITAISIIMIIVSPGTSFPIGFLGFVGALFSLSSISYDEFDNGNAFLFSLPITRKDYVLEKYIFGLISGIMFLLLGTVISLVVIGITKTGSFNEIFLTAGSLFPTILLILSIMLPFILKFGGEKGRIAIIGVMGFIFVIGLLLIKTTEYLGIDLYVLINKLPKFEPLVYIILFLLLSVVIFISVVPRTSFIASMIADFPESFSPTRTFKPFLKVILCSFPSKHLKFFICNNEIYIFLN